MKKISLLFAMLTMIVSGAWADVTGTLVASKDDLKGGEYIVLKTPATNGGNAPTTPYFNGSTAKTASIAYAQVYKLEKATNGFYLKNISTNTYIAKCPSASNQNIPTNATSKSGAEVFTLSAPFEGKSISGYTSEATASNLIRFTSSTQTSYFINAQGDNAIAQYHSGTGTWSVWNVYTLTAAEVKSLASYDLSKISFTFNNVDNTWANVVTTVKDKNDVIIDADVTLSFGVENTELLSSGTCSTDKTKLCPAVNTWVSAATENFTISMSVASPFLQGLNIGKMDVLNQALDKDGAFQKTGTVRSADQTFTFNTASKTITEDLNATVGSTTTNTVSFDAIVSGQTNTVSVNIVNKAGYGCFYALTGVNLYRSEKVGRSTAKNGYGTICLPYDATVEGATILACQGKNSDEKIVFEYATGTTDAESNKLTAGVPYLYRATADAQTFTMDYNTTYAEATTTGGAFKGSYTEEELGTNGPCILSQNKFYTVANAQSLSSTNIFVGAYRAYVTDWDDLKVINTSARAFTFSLVGGETTGINGIVDATATAKDGKFVENGKVVIVNNGKKYNVAGQAVK